MPLHEGSRKDEANALILTGGLAIHSLSTVDNCHEKIEGRSLTVAMFPEVFEHMEHNMVHTEEMSTVGSKQAEYVVDNMALTKTKRSQNYTVVDVVVGNGRPFQISDGDAMCSLRMKEGQMARAFPNSTLPTSKSEVLSTIVDGQISFPHVP
ncbi:hypothetical protein SUGI_0573300 [Cryptomeria japonica]|nr:hypothetical protein SUGI_0573300 [Cryptomeria japonica]